MTDVARGYGFGQGQGNAEQSERASGITSPTALQHVRDRLEIPGQGNVTSDFATGYSLGLIGGVRSWVGLSPDPLYHSLALSVDSRLMISR